MKITLVGRHYVIEPLGIIYLAGLARRLGWEVEVLLIKNGDFEELYRHVESWKPDIVGLSIWTGYHLQAFAACKRLLSMGAKVLIGGPHATYFESECVRHSTWTVKGEGFRNFRRILQGELSPGLHFDPERVAEGFPEPYRDRMYENYPELGSSPIKSMICTVGCPFKCTYCYAPTYNKMYGGFDLNVRPVDDLIREGQEIRDKWDAHLIYMQDDIFGNNLTWLAEFARRWPKEVGIPWHCQIRLELTRQEKRLDLFRDGGCTGITLAIESGNAFLRQHVLLREMADELIVEGIRKIQVRGLTLRTEQILSVPFSNLETDLATLELNCRLNPEMAWTSILAPYGGTVMGSIASNFGFYEKNNDDLSETFFSKSVLSHIRGGPRSVEALVKACMKSAKDNPLERMYVRKNGDSVAPLFIREGNERAGSDQCLGAVEYLSEIENEEYAEQIVALQRCFYWFAKVPKGDELARKFLALAAPERTWSKLGLYAEKHLAELGYCDELFRSTRELAREMGYGSEAELPKPIRDNPLYFAFLPGGGQFARKMIDIGAFAGSDRKAFDLVGDQTRRWLFMKSLYKIEAALPPIFRP